MRLLGSQFTVSESDPNVAIKVTIELTGAEAPDLPEPPTPDPPPPQPLS